MTRWAAQVNPAAPWPEYPRPQMVRPEWLNLNGLWSYAIRPRDQEFVRQYDGQILVPYPVESALSGVKRPLLPSERLWYRRTFVLPEAWQGRRLMLHFGAVDWETVVWVNGVEAGFHRGGFTPFTFDITDYLEPSGENELLVSVWDPTDTGDQERGKQVLEPRSIWYSAVSGIWQTVWLEPVPETAICNLHLRPDFSGDVPRLKSRADLAGPIEGLRLRLAARDGSRQVSVVEGALNGFFHLPIPEARLWSPEEPHLYDLEVELWRGKERIDRVESYFGMRQFDLGKDERGRLRLRLNGRPLFQYGPLDQGYWPDGLYTPPNEEAMLFDLGLCKQLGFNMLRKHVKVEPARFYYHCDQMGLIVWQDVPNGGKPVGDVISVLAILFGGWPRNDRRSYERAGRARKKSRSGFNRVLEAMLDTLGSFTCIGMWVPFNEGWGQFDANAIAQYLRAADPTRPVDHASGWFDQGGGDCRSLHVYFKRLPRTGPGRRAMIASEIGGYTMQVDGHQWDSEQVFGYRKFETPAALTAAYRKLLEKELPPWIRRGLSGAVYTQLVDVEIEANGFVTYDREVFKIDPEASAEAHCRLLGNTQENPPPTPP